MSFTHLNPRNEPGMVDVGDKAVTRRSATAEAWIDLPPEVAQALDGDEIRGPKGPVFQTAILAGTMAVKRTAELIPLCHPLPIEGIEIQIRPEGPDRLRITCTVRTTHKTGVEMEALTGASVAALTVYDMCKALSHALVIRDLRLTAKSGGKRSVG